MNDWQALQQRALAGQNQAAALPPRLQAAADLLQPQATAATGTAAFWNAAIVRAECERSTRLLPPTNAATLLPAAAETLLTPPPALSLALRQVIEDACPRLLQEASAVLAARGEHLPHALLPGWLGVTLKQPAEARAALLGVIGTRGRWLCALDRTWQGLLAGDSAMSGDQAWQEGTLDQRVDWLLALRRRDAAAARATLQAAWPTETPEAREKLLAVLRIGLGADDEPLLEHARNDRRKDVRLLALDQLAALPGSALVQRQFERVTDWLGYTAGGLMKRARLEVNLPAAWDKSWALDGLSEKSTPILTAQGIGDKANWLQEALGMVPLPRLLAHWGIGVADWGKLLHQHDFAAALWAGTVTSVGHHPHRDLLALRKAAASHRTKTALLYGALDQIRQTGDWGWLQPWLRDEPASLLTVVQLLPALPAAFSAVLLHEALASMQKSDNVGAWLGLAPPLSQVLHGSHLAEWRAALEAHIDTPYTGQTLQAAIETARLRLALFNHQPRE